MVRLRLVYFVSVLLCAQTVQLRAQKPDLVVQTGHSLLVQSVAFSPDGQTLASGSGDNTIKLWEVRTGLELHTFSGHSGGVESIAFSADGQTLASGSDDNTIKLWEVRTGRELHTLSGHSDHVMSVAFSADDQTLASGSKDNTIKLWEARTARELRTLRGHSGWVESVGFSADGQTLASGSWDNTIKLWEVRTGREMRTLRGHSGWVESVGFSADGQTLASGSADGTVKLWEVATGQELRTLRGHTDSVKSVGFSADGQTLASGSADGTVKLWEVATGQELRTLRGHTDPVESLAFSADGKMLASGGVDKTIKLWEVATGRELRTLSENGETVISIAFSADRKTLAIGSADKTIKLWEVVAGLELRTLRGHSHWVNSVAFSGDGQTLASGSGGPVKLWNVATGRELHTLRGHSHWVNSVAFSADGQTLASGSADQTIKLWEVATGRELRTLRGHSEFVNSVAFSADGQTLASGSADKTIKLWEVRTGRELHTFSGHSGGVESVAFSADGQTLASGSADKTIKLWDVATERELRTLRGHSEGVISVAFSVDGQTLASGSWDHTIKLWKVAMGRELHTLRGHSGRVKSVAFSADGRFLFSGSADTTIRLWRVDTEELMASLIALDEADWVVTTPEGRFDTNKSLDRIEGLHWVVNGEILKPVPLDVFMRQYYEPGLLQRILKGEQFKPLPSIAEINRVQPKVAIKEIKSAAGATDSVDVTVEVENVTQDVSVSATDRTKQKRLSSGAFDLRLFRDGQLVGVSTPKDKLACFISDAPRLIAETKASGRLLDTPEDRAWREANDIFTLKAENIKPFSPDRVSYTFRNIKLPKDGRKEVAFTAYAFNGDRVKSTTTHPHNFTIPNSVAASPKMGRAYLISIGVNLSENPAYDLRYAANDARKMQEILGARLKAYAAKYDEVIQVPLISEYGPDKKLAENKAQKAIIKGVFSLLAGNEKEIPENVLKQIPNREQIKAVEPEDTLIIAYSGHGYADQSGIFYLLPYDIGKDTTKLTTEALQKAISSDELSLWMQDITAAEMIMIIDACHSSAAVQGDGFKPGPMGSRGLGQLAYDKDMKILSATQANNIALELGTLEQGLLSYALLQDGITKSLADADKNKELLPAEWLAYAEKRVPELYREVKDGKRGVLLNGRSTERLDLSGKQKSSLNLQQPSLFDFKRRSSAKPLFVLPDR